MFFLGRRPVIRKHDGLDWTGLEWTHGCYASLNESQDRLSYLRLIRTQNNR